MAPTSQEQPEADDNFLFRGESEAARSVRNQISLASRVESTVLVLGESGVGKELVARDIHLNSLRRDKPFIPLNCAAIPDNLIETELFGHEKGAFTDARDQRKGAFELSNQGTLFLDEVGDMAVAAQPKLLRVLETGEVSRVGGETSKKLDLRVVAATNHNLRKMCRTGHFRSDLYYRLCVLEVRIPPLRERLEDIGLLAVHFASELATKTGRGFTGISDKAVEYLKTYNWPGNARQLKHAVERAMAMNSGTFLEADHFDLDPVSMPGSMGSLLNREWRQAREAFEAAYAKALLDRHDGNVAKAARAAGLAPGGLYKMLRRVGLPPGGKSS
ncbi:MAG: sigma-54-dependent Fis family transcriptional regulator [bacterium]|nr:sigma-54-dependent Fis family transcriptional regulator [bacterium]